MIARVVFDLPVPRSFSYAVPPGLTVAAGQRVRAPLRGRGCVGVVVAVEAGAGEGLKPIAGCVESGPILSPAQLDLTRWIAEESLSSWGSTLTALLPPPPRALSEITASPPDWPQSPAQRPRLLTGGDRERRLLACLREAAEAGGVLLLTPDIDTAATWATRLRATLERPVVRLDSGVSERQRWSAWMTLVRGAARVGVGTRSALLAPVPPPTTLVLIDEHDPAHKPPGAPRIHSREVIHERAGREGSLLYLTAGTPSVESWWRAEQGHFERLDESPSPWPRVSVVDTRRTPRGQVLSRELRQGMKATLAASGQVLLLVTRAGSAMVCRECGLVLRCPDCRIALAFSRARRELACRLCRRQDPAPATCPHCHGRELAPFGWGTERVAESVRAALPHVRVVRYDAESRRDRAVAQAIREGKVRIVVGTRGALKVFRPSGPALVGFINPDPMLALPDFRAAERTFSLLWTGAERVAEGGGVVIQTRHPSHYAVRAVASQDLATFYKHELKFRTELGYPPLSRLCLIRAQSRTEEATKELADALHRELHRLPGVTVYPAAPVGRSPGSFRRRIVLKGGDDLPGCLGPVLSSFLERGRGGRGIIEVEMDPVELI